MNRRKDVREKRLAESAARGGKGRVQPSDALLSLRWIHCALIPVTNRKEIYKYTEVQHTLITLKQYTVPCTSLD